jgi:cobalamin-dependent methionine synthase I
MLDSTYSDALSLYPVDVVNQRLVSPLLRIIGERWKEREAGISEEHFFSVYLRNKLGARIHHLNQNSSGPLLILACLPGEYHEIGLLLFALATVNFGYRVLILGSNTPLEQLPKVLQQQTCAGIVLSGSAKPSRSLFDSELSELVKTSAVPVFIGGKTAAKYQQKIEASGAIYLGESISAGLRSMSQLLKTGK